MNWLLKSSCFYIKQELFRKPLYKHSQQTVRVVHLGPPNAEQEIRTQGLKYHGDITTTTRAWLNKDQAVYTTNDPRFAGSIAYVFDVPISEYNKHTKPEIAPGLLPAQYLTEIKPQIENAPRAT